MNVMILLEGGDFNDLPQVKCSECESVFSVVYKRNPFYENIEWCPFCGEEIDEFVQEKDYYQQ